MNCFLFKLIPTIIKTVRAALEISITFFYLLKEEKAEVISDDVLRDR